MTEEMIKIGKLAPDFELPDWKDDLLKLSHFRGQHAVLLFTNSIENEEDFALIKEFNQLNDRFAELQATVLVITTDDIGTLQEAVNKHQLETVLLSDVLTTVHQQYDALEKGSKKARPSQKMKTMAVVIDPNGKILKIFEKETQNDEEFPTKILEWMKSIQIT